MGAVYWSADAEPLLRARACEMAAQCHTDVHIYTVHIQHTHDDDTYNVLVHISVTSSPGTASHICNEIRKRTCSHTQTLLVQSHWNSDLPPAEPASSLTAISSSGPAGRYNIPVSHLQDVLCTFPARLAESTQSLLALLSSCHHLISFRDHPPSFHSTSRETSSTRTRYLNRFQRLLLVYSVKRDLHKQCLLF